MLKPLGSSSLDQTEQHFRIYVLCMFEREKQRERGRERNLLLLDGVEFQLQDMVV